MPTVPLDSVEHRAKVDRMPNPFRMAAIARAFPKKDIEKFQEAMDARDIEWANLLKRGCWNFQEKPKEWSRGARDTRLQGRTVHMGRIFGFMVEKNYESVQHRKFKYRVVFQGNQVIDQNWETALFQDLGSSPASMEASKIADLHGCLPGHEIEQADAEQAYLQADLSGKETWILMPKGRS